jgi:hypothetical protein
MELGIRLSFDKTSEFRGEGLKPPLPPRYATGREVDENCTLLDYHAASDGNSLPPVVYIAGIFVRKFGNNEGMSVC